MCVIFQVLAHPDPSSFAVAVTQCVVKLKETGKLVALAEHGKSALGDQLLAEQQGSKL